MAAFEDLLHSAGYLRDDDVVGPVPDLQPPSTDDLDRLYEEIAEEADVESDALLLEFAPLPSVRGAHSWFQVAVWYDGDLTAAERGRIAQVLRRRFRGRSAATKASSKSRRGARGGSKRNASLGS